MQQKSHIQVLADKIRESGYFEVKTGLSSRQLEAIRDAFGVAMPKDLEDLLTRCVPVAFRGKRGEFVDWHSDPKQIAFDSRLRLEEILKFDVLENQYWCKEFGEKPDDLDRAFAVAKEIVNGWDPLVPLFGHRMMPSNVTGATCPVLSVWQFVDSIIYADDLYSYFLKEFDLELPRRDVDEANLVDIPHWGEAFLA